jgi:N-acetylmuramoyl-L-alanine amidase
VETAFISNPEEEQRLRDPDFRQVLARTLHNAIVAHFVKAPPAHSDWSATRHVLKQRGKSGERGAPLRTECRSLAPGQ